MKYLKKILFVFIIFILSGCSVEYNLYVNEDKTVSEKVIAEEKTNKLESLTRTKGDQAITYIYNMYKREGEDINLSNQSSKDTTKVLATAYHNNIEEYASKFTSDVIKKADVTKSDGVVTLLLNQSQKLNNDESYSLIYDNIKVNINIPFKVIEHNADTVTGNTYTWNISRNSDLKNIKISYDEEKIKNKTSIKINNKTFNINYGIIAGSVIIVLVLLIILFVYVNNKKHNKF